jgi:intracellular septation protein
MADQQHPAPQPAPDQPEPGQQSLKLAIDLAPLLIFFGVYMTAGIYWATGVLMVATVISMIVSKVLLNHVSASLVISTALVVGFGALTLWFSDPRFIKMKPTIIYLMFAVALVIGYLLGKPVLKLLMGEALRLTDHGWSVLSLRWAIFFTGLAALNEVVWRNFSETTWATVKVFGFLPLTVIFLMMQISFIQCHQPTNDSKSD